MKTTDFIKENKFIGDDAHAMHQDHEVQMARSDCYNAAKYAIELHKLLKNISEMEGLDGWVSEKITLANDYLRTVAEYLRHQELEQQNQMSEVFTAESANAKFAELLGEDQNVAEAGKPDVMRHTGDKTVKVVKRGGKPVGEIGIDAGPGGNGDYYVKLYDGSYDAAGFDTAEEALEELRYAVKQMSEGPETGIGSKLPKSDIETFGLQKGRPYKLNPPQDWKPGDRKRAVQQLIPTQDKKDHIRSRLGKHVAPVLPEQDVAEGSENNPVVNAITRRIMLQRTDLLSKYGPEKVGQAIDEVADFVGDVEEIGSSDVSGWIRHVEQMLGNMSDQSLAETTSAGGVATVPGVGGGPKVGSLFGGSYSPKTPFTGKKKAKESVIKR